jgi:hypothetical protein
MIGHVGGLPARSGGSGRGPGLRSWFGRRWGRVLFIAALAFASPFASPLLHVNSAAYAAGNCAVWSTYTEQDGKAQNLTAFACASTLNDSSVVGLQCLRKRPQLRYYPGDGAQESLRNRASLAATFAVGDQSVAETMRYDAAIGVFTVNIGRNAPLLQMLQSGGPLDLASDTLGPHRFRLLGSTAAIAAVMSQCGIKRYIGPPPPVAADDSGQ